MASLRERRQQQAVADMARLSKQRDDTLDKLTRIVARLKKATRAVERYERTPQLPAARPTAPAVVEPPAPPPASQAPTAVAAVSAPASGDLDIPDFLRRGMAAQTAADKVIAEQLKNERAERKKAKSRGRIAAMKAKQSGETKRMPLEGKAALAAIRGG